MRALFAAFLGVVLLSGINSAAALDSEARFIENELVLDESGGQVPAVSPRSSTDAAHIVNDRIADGQTEQRVYLGTTAAGDTTVSALMADAGVTLQYKLGESTATYTDLYSGSQPNDDDTISISASLPNHLIFQALGTETHRSDSATNAIVLCDDEQFDSSAAAKGVSTAPALASALDSYFNGDNVAQLPLTQMLVMFELGDAAFDFQDLVILVDLPANIHCGEFHFSQIAGTGGELSYPQDYFRMAQAASSNGANNHLAIFYVLRHDPSSSSFDQTYSLQACIAPGPYPNLAACNKAEVDTLTGTTDADEYYSIDMALGNNNTHAMVWMLDDRSPADPCTGGLFPVRRYYWISFTEDDGLSWSTPYELFRACVDNQGGSNLGVPDDIDITFNDDGDLGILLNTFTLDFSGDFDGEQMLLNNTYDVSTNNESLVLLLITKENLEGAFNPESISPSDFEIIEILSRPENSLHWQTSPYRNMNMADLVGGPGNTFFAAFRYRNYTIPETRQSVWIRTGSPVTETLKGLGSPDGDALDAFNPKTRRSLNGAVISTQDVLYDVLADGTVTERPNFTGPIYLWPVGDPTTLTVATGMDYTDVTPFSGWDGVSVTSALIDNTGQEAATDVMSAPVWNLSDGSAIPDCDSAVSGEHDCYDYRRVAWATVTSDIGMINGFAAALDNYYYMPSILVHSSRADDGSPFLENHDMIVVSKQRLDPPAANQPPTIVTIGDQEIDEGQQLLFTVTANDDQGTPSISAAYPGGTFGATFVDNGNGTGTFSWTPTHRQSGDDYQVVFTANDGELDSLPESVLIDVFNDPTTPPTVDLDVSDPNPAPGEGFTITVTASAEAGLVSAWWGIRDLNDPGSQNIQGTVNGVQTNLAPAQDWGECMGDYSCEYSRTVTIDAEGDYEVWANSRDILYFHETGVPHQASEGVGLAIVEVNVAPAFAAMPAVNPVVAGQTVSFNVTATDENGDTMKLEMIDRIAGATFVSSQGASTLSDASSITGRFTWSPKTYQTGSFSVRFRATDSQGLSTISDPVKIEVKRLKPTLFNALSIK